MGVNNSTGVKTGEEINPDVFYGSLTGEGVGLRDIL